MIHTRRLFLLAAALLLVGTMHAQSLTVSVSTPGVSWSSLVPGSANNPGSATVNVTTTWSLSPKGGGDNMRLYAYFATPSAALAHQSVCSSGCTDIPSSAFQISVNSGGFQAVTGTSSYSAGGTLLVFSQPITGANKTGSRMDTLAFNIDLSALPQLPADTYKGVLNIVAESLP